MRTTITARRIRVLATTILFGTTLLLGACAQDSAGKEKPTTATGAAAYAQCMRDNGVPGFPDPDSNDDFAIDGSKLGVDMESDQYKKAEEACASLLPEDSAEQKQEDYEARLEYAQCMREQGMAGFPDPPVPGEGGDTQENSDGSQNDGPEIDPESPQFKAAHESCKNLLPEGDEGPSLSGK